MGETLALHPQTPAGTGTTGQARAEQPRPAVVADMEGALAEFKRVMTEYLPMAFAMHEAAKKLYKEMGRHWSADKRHVASNEMHAAGLAQDLLGLQAKQEPLWATLEKDANALRERVDRAYKLVQDADAAVLRACAYKGTNAAWGGFTTPEMEAVRHFHSKKLRTDVHEAKVTYEEVCGFPDGLLTRIGTIQKRVLKETEALIESTAKKEHNKHHPF